MMTATLLATLVGLAVIDSINPSALVAAGLILTKAPQERKNRAILWYVVGVYVAYLLFGIALTFGLDTLIATFSSVINNRLVYILQAILGVAMLTWAILFKPRPRRTEKITPRLFTSKSLFLLGAAVTLAEVVTAFPYFGAIGIMEQAGLLPLVSVVILLFYNIIFVLPPLILALIYRFNKERFDDWLQKRQSNSKPSDIMQWVVGIIGFLLLRSSLFALGIFGNII
jgi:cytochrome c biogenesis protein CcdA